MAVQDINRTCEQCGGLFQLSAKSQRQRFCSLRCSKRHRPICPEADRFWPKVNRTGPLSVDRPDIGPCWIWTAAINGNGYGQFMREDQRQTSAHLWAFKTCIGPIPDGLELDHLCRVRHCVNPAHLEAVTSRVNLLRGESFYAQNARKAECKRGHVFNEANTLRIPKGRACRTCRRENQSQHRQQRSERQRERRQQRRDIETS